MSIVLKIEQWLNKERFGHLIWWVENLMRQVKLNQLLLLCHLILFNNKLEPLLILLITIMLLLAITMVMSIFLITMILLKELQPCTNLENGVRHYLIPQMATTSQLDPMMIQFISIKWIRVSILFTGQFNMFIPLLL